MSYMDLYSSKKIEFLFDNVNGNYKYSMFPANFYYGFSGNGF